jgi:hypothetical protein
LSWGELERDWRDLHAQYREQSYVSANTYAQIQELVDASVEASVEAGLANASTRLIAKVIARRLDVSGLEEIVADWLEDRGRGI